EVDDHSAPIDVMPQSSAPSEPEAITRILMTPFAAGPQVLTSRRNDVAPRAVERVAGAPDRETLLSVARAATKLTSSYDKAELLVPIAKYYGTDAELSNAYLTAAASITADYDCARTFIAFLASNPISDDGIELAMSSAGTKITSDYEKVNVILAALAKGRP